MSDSEHHDEHEQEFEAHPRGESGLWLGVFGVGLGWMGLFALTWWLAGFW